MNAEFKQKIKFVYKDLEGNIAIESVWAEKHGDFYKIKNVPFFAPNIAFDDIISVEYDDEELFFDEIIEESGNSTIQIIVFNESLIPEITGEIERFNCGWEGSHLKGYISVNVPKDVSYLGLKQFLDSKSNDLDYKEACLAHTV
ncbi:MULTISPECIES: DUF4265 domain-containing protein [unclassified Flavobacterium]|uniref:DUF4265 domain-containing protein n=1 Tax=unclassified Flavobacterium TaxID=196869 RepID=UPI0009611EF9|nr:MULTISPECIES: DUF4265 domain-containing protein [unclassified Flavobacterium]MBN9284088.1 DUF4265 domain-containing protein [Flavobacterium sp.]OJV71103.1 MAG: hypothetical protein BGO42_04630 [Flavobacterium sp. 40-81]